MSRTRIHNLAISLDGFATREPQSTEAPFGHAGQRLHDWMFGTRFWARQGAPGGAADAGGSAGVDGMTITQTANGETLIAGLVADQAALYGLLRKVRDLGLPLLALSSSERTGLDGFAADSGDLPGA